MSDLRGSPLLALDPATPAQAGGVRLSHDTPSTPAPSAWEKIWTAAKGAAGADELGDAREQDAVNNAFAPIVDELHRRGIAGDYSWSFLGGAPYYNPDAIFQGIGKARAVDPKAFAGVETDYNRFRQRVTAPVRADLQPDRDVEAQTGWVPRIIGGLAGGASDPLNMLAMASGVGEAKTVAQAAIGAAKANLAFTAAIEPSEVIERATRGQDTTPTDVATDLGMAAATGGVLGAAAHPLAPVDAPRRIHWRR